jgi:hypothetical protein
LNFDARFFDCLIQNPCIKYHGAPVPFFSGLHLIATYQPLTTNADLKIVHARPPKGGRQIIGTLHLFKSASRRT